MRIVETFRNVPPQARGASAAIGNFDGVHLGHRSVIDMARRPDAPLAVVTFEPHPREVFAPDAQPFRLMNAETRAHRLERLGLDTLFQLPFDQTIWSLTPEGFAREVIAEGLGLSHVVIGGDFRFGKDRAGGARDLADFGRQMGFETTIAPLVSGEGSEISSTRIRRALAEGRVEDANGMLGHLHRIDGPVLHGDRRGRDLGYPTANMSMDGLHLPAFGVYAVVVDVLDGAHTGTYGGVASLGVRPMFGENTPNLETFLFDFSGDLYGAELSVGLVGFLRGERNFDGIDALIAQMDQDSAEARRILSSR